MTPYLGKNYTGHPTIQVGSRVRCLKKVQFVDGTLHNKNDEFMVDAHNINYYRYHTPGDYEVISNPKR